MVRPLDLTDGKVIHISAWAKTFTQFRMPLIRKQRDIFKRVVIYCPDHKEHVQRLSEEGVEVKNGPVSTRWSPGIIAQILFLYNYLRKERFDILMAHQPMGALVGIPAAHFARVPIIIYSTGGLKYFPDKKNILNPLIKYGELGVIKWSNAVFLVNKEDEGLLKKIPSVKDKTYYVGPRGGCGIDTKKYSVRNRLNLRTYARKKLGLGEDTFIVGYAGRCVWEKGIKEIVNAAYTLRDEVAGNKMRFLILGEGQHISKIINYIDKKGLTSKFEVLGYKFNLDYYMATFDLFLLPSYREGLPVSLLEAMAMGIPCIATNIRGNRELIIDGETGILVPVRNPEKLSKAILLIKNSSDKGASLGNQAAEYVLNNYSEGVMINKTLDIINNLIEKKYGISAYLKKRILYENSDIR